MGDVEIYILNVINGLKKLLLVFLRFISEFADTAFIVEPSGI